MAYSSGGIIQATDYNNMAWGGAQGTYTASPSNIAYVMGVGSGAFGYGQDVSAINAVSASAVVTAVQWSGLLTTLNKALGHQSGSAAQLSVSPAITAGNQITYFSTVATAVGTINTNKALFTSQGSTTTGTNFTTSVVSTTGWNYYVDRVVTFASANAARYFFNAGGQLNFVVSTSGGTGTASNNSHNNIVTALGGISAFRNTTNGGRTGTGLTLNTNNTAFGYRNNVFNTESEIVKVTDSTAAYTANYGRLIAWTNSNDTTNGSNGATVVFRINMVGSDKTWNDSVNCTLNTRVDIVYPETTYLASSWGTPTVS